MIGKCRKSGAQQNAGLDRGIAWTRPMAGKARWIAQPSGAAGWADRLADAKAVGGAPSDDGSQHQPALEGHLRGG